MSAGAGGEQVRSERYRQYRQLLKNSLASVGWPNYRVFQHSVKPSKVVLTMPG